MPVSMSKTLKRISYAGVTLAVIWIALMNYWGRTAPLTPDESSGRIYEYNFHGTIVYLNLVEQLLQFALPGGGFLIFVILWILHGRNQRENKKWPPEDT